MTDSAGWLVLGWWGWVLASRLDLCGQFAPLRSLLELTDIEFAAQSSVIDLLD